MTMAPSLKLTVNGRPRDVEGVPGGERLLDTLRWRLELKGTKEGCRTGGCGACTVLLDGRSALSCLVLSGDVEGRDVVTIEALAERAGAKLVAEAFAEAGGVQCGYCTPGFVVAVQGLLEERPHEAWTTETLASELGGNLCRCTGYYGILRALARRLSSEPVPASTFERVGGGGP